MSYYKSLNELDIKFEKIANKIKPLMTGGIFRNWCK